jgi:hypothetical protein
VVLGAASAWCGAAAGPARAQNACEVIKHTFPARHGHARPPLVIGDSGMIYAAPVLSRLGFEANARGCRQMSAALDILAARKRAGTLPRLDVVSAGANGPVSDGDIRRALSILGPHRVLGLVTPPTSASSSAAMRRAAARLPERVVLIDWAATGLGPRYGGGDPIHIGPAGESVLAHFLRRRVAPYFPPAALKLPPKRSDAVKDCGVVHRAGQALGVYVIRGRRKILCERARAIVRARIPRAVAGWHWYAWSIVGAGPWIDAFERPSGEVVIASAPAPRRGHR